MSQNDYELVESHRDSMDAVQQLSPDIMLIKMEQESLMAVARTRPRDNKKIIRELQELIEIYPQAADEAIYSKPVGTITVCECGDCHRKYEVSYINEYTECDRCGSKKILNQKKTKKFAEGLSIRAAESIRSIYGYTRLETRCEILEDGKAKLTGVFVDYAAGNITTDTRVVSPFYKARSGKMERTPEDRFLGVIVKAEKSKLRRDIILDSVPNHVKMCFRDACEKRLLQLLSPEEIEKKILPAFAQYGITEQHLEKLLGVPRAMGWAEEHKLKLRNILTGLKNEETTVRELLEDLDESKVQSPSAGTSKSVANGAVSGKDFAKKKIEPVTTPETPHVEPPSQAAIVESAANGTAELGSDVVAKFSYDLALAVTEDEVEEVYKRYKDRVDGVSDACLNRVQEIQADDAINAVKSKQPDNSSAVDNQPQQHDADSERIAAIREKINSYKQPGRLTALVNDAKADKSFSPQEVQQIEAMVSARLKQLSGTLPGMD